MSRRDYFDERADTWDTITESHRLIPALREGLTRLGLEPSEHVLDLGCGTGVLLGCLLDHLGPDGRVEAVDFAARMIAAARTRHPDPRVRFHLADAALLPLADGTVDRVICFSAWPHFPDPGAVIAELRRVLKTGGDLHLWHEASRQTINAIHQGVGGAIAEDLLLPAEGVAQQLHRQGFEIQLALDDERRYLISARRTDGP